MHEKTKEKNNELVMNSIQLPIVEAGQIYIKKKRSLVNVMRELGEDRWIFKLVLWFLSSRLLIGSITKAYL